MELKFLLLALVAIIPTAQAQNKPGVRSNCGGTCYCTQSYIPFCATDGRTETTYINKCELECAQKCNRGLRVKFEGVCAEPHNPSGLSPGVAYNPRPTQVSSTYTVGRPTQRPLYGASGQVINPWGQRPQPGVHTPSYGQTRTTQRPQYGASGQFINPSGQRPQPGVYVPSYGRTTTTQRPQYGASGQWAQGSDPRPAVITPSYGSTRRPGSGSWTSGGSSGGFYSTIPPRTSRPSSGGYYSTIPPRTSRPSSGSSQYITTTPRGSYGSGGDYGRSTTIRPWWEKEPLSQTTQRQPSGYGGGWRRDRETSDDYEDAYGEGRLEILDERK